MKQIKIYLFALLAVLSLAACSSSDDGNGNGSGNTNKNEITTDKAVARLEFPKLKGGNSIVIVHRDGNNSAYDPDNVNFSTEWDCDLKSQRWSCYIITTKNRAKNTNRYYDKNNQYPNDPALTSAQRWEKDYIYRSGFDHGHICNSNVVPMPTIKLSISPICSHNIASLMEVIPTISIKGFGSRWRTT